MELVRFRGPDGPRVGVSAAGRVSELAGVESMSELLAMPLLELRALVEDAARTSGDGLPASQVELLAPVDGRTEVWASGVTYEVSREARMEESRHAATVYERVYDAERPELFFKAASWRVAGDGDPIAIREDSTLDVPEPEVAIMLNRSGEVVGYTACNDVSSRSIEGDNPLYLPQAKIYLGSCALGPVVRPAWEVADPYDLTIELVIERDGKTVWEGATSTAKLHRRYDELAGYLFRADRYPEGAVLSTGTCLVPEAPFGLAPGDMVRVKVAGIGTLSNPVVRGLAALEAHASPELRRALAPNGKAPAGEDRRAAPAGEDGGAAPTGEDRRAAPAGEDGRPVP